MENEANRNSPPLINPSGSDGGAKDGGGAQGTGDVTEAKTDRDAPALERILVQWLLRGGLGLASALMLLGIALQIFSGPLDGRALLPGQIFSDDFSAAERLMGGGILVLAMTPAVRVVALFFLWMRERDWRFVAVAAAVIATLGAALALGGG